MELYDVKVLNAEGTGTIENLISATEWCIKEKVNIINISFGFQSENEDLQKAISTNNDSEFSVKHFKCPGYFQ